MMPLSDDQLPMMPIDLRTLQRRAQLYSERCQNWLATVRTQTSNATSQAPDATAIVGRLAVLVPTEIGHALSGWLSPAADKRELTIDPEDAAAIALVAIEHSRNAWLMLVKHQQIRAIAAEPFISDLVWLKHEVERTFPNCRLHAL